MDRIEKGLYSSLLIFALVVAVLLRVNRLFVVSEWQGEIIALVGLIGTFGTLLGLLVATSQLRKARRAAEAAESATRQTLAEVQTSLRRHIAANCQRFLADAKHLFDKKDWSAVARRVSDVADQAAQMAQVGADSSESWLKFAESLRNWEVTFKSLASGQRQLTQDLQTKWGKLGRDLARLLDAQCGPLIGIARGQNHDPS